MNNLLAEKRIKEYLIEDIGTGDLSVEAIFDENSMGSGIFMAKDDGILCGGDMISMVYKAYGADVSVELYKKDGENIHYGDKIAYVNGSVKALLSCERLILNIMQRMSGIASLTSRAVKLLNDDSIRICDTRKTMPGMRMFDKYAVKCGGGYNHRTGLYDGIMLKDNHIAFAGGIKNAVAMAQSKVGHMVKIEVEIENAQQAREAAQAGVDVIMLDNRTPDEIRHLIKLIPTGIITEASGGISLSNIAEYSNTGVNYISLGALTHSVPAFDISFNSMEGTKI